MTECPICGRDITMLKEWQSGEKAWYYDGERYEELEFCPDDGTNDYECPECCEVLFTNEDDAREFLKPTKKLSKKPKKK